MSFLEAVQAGFRNWNKIHGRAVRSEFWWWMLFAFLSLLLFGAVAAALDYPAVVIAAYPLLSWVLLIVSVTVGIRRLHDTDRSGWWLLLTFVPYVGWAVELAFLTANGSPGPNRFGERPGGNLPTYRPAARMPTSAPSVLGRAHGLDDARAFFQANLDKRSAILKAIEEGDQAFWQSLPARLGVHELQLVGYKRGPDWLEACARYDVAYTSTMMSEVGRLFVTVLPRLDGSVPDDADEHA